LSLKHLVLNARADGFSSAAAILAGGLAVGAYLNAKYHIAHDLDTFAGHWNPRTTRRFVEQQFAQGRLLHFNILEDHALRQRPDQLFLIFEERTFTYLQFYNAVVRAGNWLLKDLDVQRGEIVALVGGNSPEFLILWYALEGIGAIPSFVNYNLSGNSLLHCIKVRNLNPQSPLLTLVLDLQLSIHADRC
jgi:hypothetical protein